MPKRARVALIGAVCAWVGAALAGPSTPVLPRAEFLQSYRWSRDEPAFGGFSGLELDASGQDFVVLSDRATLWRGQLQRGPDGQIAGVQVRSGPVVLHDSKGGALTRGNGDSEGVALAEDGSVYVSFEGQHRVAHYPQDAGPAERLPRPEAFKKFQANSSLEALAIGPDGALYTLPERSGGLGMPFPVWRYRDGGWTQPFTLPRDGDWLPVGADFGPDGRFYLLERDFWGLLGFLTRVRVFDIQGDTVTGGEVLVQTF
ncbi:MAG: esterase-like activity of phytase family protein, partial [Paracoccaceae bacterium]|nr:esterase-like activity of phytase family protein [Paracoccaceae bacterium]